MGENNLPFGPIPKFKYFVLWFWPFPPKIQTLQATFKAVLITVYMTKALQCIKCVWGPGMILPALWKNTFLKKAVWFFHYPRWPPHRVWWKTKKKFFLAPFPKLCKLSFLVTVFKFTYWKKKKQMCRNLHIVVNCWALIVYPGGLYLCFESRNKIFYQYLKMVWPHIETNKLFEFSLRFMKLALNLTRV